jgi:hypothetical protein
MTLTICVFVAEPRANPAALLDSLVKQSFKDFEVLLLLSNSNPALVETLKPYEDVLRLRLLTVDSSALPLDSINGRFIKFLKSTDLLTDTDALAWISMAARLYPQHDFGFSGLQISDRTSSSPVHLIPQKDAWPLLIRRKDPDFFEAPCAARLGASWFSKTLASKLATSVHPPSFFALLAKAESLVIVPHSLLCLPSETAYSQDPLEFLDMTVTGDDGCQKHAQLFVEATLRAFLGAPLIYVWKRRSRLRARRVSPKLKLGFALLFAFATLSKAVDFLETKIRSFLLAKLGYPKLLARTIARHKNKARLRVERTLVFLFKGSFACSVPDPTPPRKIVWMDGKVVLPPF